MEACTGHSVTHTHHQWQCPRPHVVLLELGVVERGRLHHALCGGQGRVPDEVGDVVAVEDLLDVLLADGGRPEADLHLRAQPAVEITPLPPSP